MRLIHKTVLMVLAHRQFSDEEYASVTAVLEREGCRIRVAGTSRIPMMGTKGTLVRPHALLSEVMPSGFDALVLIGGNGARDYWSHPRMHNVLRAFHSSGKIIAAICVAPVALGRAGLLIGVPATSHPSVKRELENTGAAFSPDEVVQSDRLLTARGPEAAKAFAEKLVELLDGAISNQVGE